MKRLLLSLVIIASLATIALADPPCGRRSFYSNSCYTPTYTPTVVTPAVIVQEAVPTFLFQTVQNYAGLPPAVTGQPPISSPPAFSMAPQTPQNAPGGEIMLSDRQLDRLADLILKKSQVAVVTNIMAPPELGEDKVNPSQLALNQIGGKCYSCHTAGVQTKGGLAIFDEKYQFNPTQDGKPYANLARLYERAAEGSMPPAAKTDPGKKLEADGLALLRQLAGQ
jgi:hypothetical protein